jgi:hypothetical protein
MSLPSEPGIYRDISWDQYNEIDAVRRSFLWDLFKLSPGHAQHFARVHKESDAMDFGTMVHTALLQPEEFPRCYTIMPAFEADAENLTKQGKVPASPKATTYYREKAKAFEAMCASTGTSIVPQAQYDAAYEMGKKIRGHQVAAKFFQRGASSEAVVLWRHEPTGLLCKARFDCLVEGELPTALDVKTTADALPRGFGYSIRKWGYYFQAAFYLSGLRAVGLKHPNFLFLAGESKEPYAVIV